MSIACFFSKHAIFCQTSLSRSMPFDQADPVGSENWKRVFESAFDAIIIHQVSDKGSNMLPAMKDVAVRLSSIANTVNDIGPCSIHIVQTITNTVNEVRDQVGRMHCFGNIARQASFLIANCSAIEYLSEATRGGQRPLAADRKII